MTDLTLEIHATTDLNPYEDTNDPTVRTHIINPPENLHVWEPGMTSQEVVEIARFRGLVIKALCGYVFIPKHNPDKFDVCKACVEVAGELMRERGE